MSDLLFAEDLRNPVKLRYAAEKFEVKAAWKDELERLRYGTDLETQLALNHLLEHHAYRIGRNVAHNLTTVVGRNLAMTRVLPNGEWFIFLKGSGAVADTNTMASHSPWVELAQYSQLQRLALVLGT